MIRILFFLIILITSNTFLFSKEPDYSSIVVVSSPGKIGTGAYIEYEELKGILTCAHAISPRIKVEFENGKSVHLNYVDTDKFGNDLAFAPYENKELIPLKMELGEQSKFKIVEFRSKGTGSKRQYFGEFERITKYADNEIALYNANVISGDSGGPALTENGTVIGVQIVGQERIPGTDNQYYGSGTVPGTTICKFLRRVKEKIQGSCPNGFCRPPGAFQPPANPDRKPPPSSFPKKSEEEVPIPYPPPEKPRPALPPKPKEEVKQEIDYDKLAEAISKNLKNDPSFQQSILASLESNIKPIIVEYEGKGTRTPYEVRPGGTIKIPAIKMSMQDYNGIRVTTEKQLGSHIILEQFKPIEKIPEPPK